MKEGLDQENLDLLSGYSDSRDGAEEGDVLFDTFRELLSFKTAPVADPCIYSATISSLSHNRLAIEASALLRSYSLRGGYEAEEMYTSAIYAFRYQRNPDAAEAVFNTLKARATRYPDLFPGKEPLTVSAASYNALLAVYAVSNELDDRGDKLLKEMEEKRLAWDSYTYTALMMGRGDRQEVST
jgi:pentatricopeptide repeat protein